MVEKLARGVKREREESTIGEETGVGAKDEGEDGGTKAARRCSRSASPDSSNHSAQDPTPSSFIGAPFVFRASTRSLGDLNRGTVDPRKLWVAVGFRGLGASEILVQMKLTTKRQKAFRAYASQCGCELEHCTFSYGDTRLRAKESLLESFPDWSFLEWEEAAGDTMSVDVAREVRGRKPVIYLFPPSTLPSVNVALTLVPEWTFSALYPLAPITRLKFGGSSTKWTVSAASDGTLVELSTNT